MQRQFNRFKLLLILGLDHRFSIGNPGTNVTKPSLFSTDKEAKEAGAFALGKLFQPGLILSIKASNQRERGIPHWDQAGKAGLLVTFINYSRKMFYNIGPSCQCFKPFFTSLLTKRTNKLAH
jgi:hypothetical protein